MPARAEDGHFYRTACPCPLGDEYRGLDEYQVWTVRKYLHLIAQDQWAQFRQARIHQLTPSIQGQIAEALGSGRGVFLTGDPGRGKTHAGFGVLRESAYAGLYPEALNVSVWLDAMRRALHRADPDSPAVDDILVWPQRAGVLVVDDFGLEKVSDWTVEKLTNLLDARWQVVQARVTVITSNYTLDELASRIGDRVQGKRIASRIAGTCAVITVEGRDWRVPC